MRRVLYMTELNIYTATSLRELRSHVAFSYKRNEYEGDYVHRFLYRNGRWERDYFFLAQIEVVRGKVILRRIRVHSISGIGIPTDAKP